MTYLIGLTSQLNDYQILQVTNTYTMKLFLKAVAILITALLLLALYGRWKISESHVLERDENYQARIHYLWKGLPELESLLPLEDKKPIWLFRDLKNPLMEKGPYLVSYPAEKSKTSTSVLILPGGGYNFRSEKAEGEDIAQWLNTQGISAFVLNYRLQHHPAPLDDSRLAISYLRHHAEEFNIDPERIGVMGFSAGGHLAASVSTLHDAVGSSKLPSPYHQHSSRPDFSILAYPVITMQDEFTHGGSRSELLGDTETPELIALLSTEAQVTPATPPSFIWAPKTDYVVPYENAELYAQALKKAGVEHELHLFPEGSHGSALAQEEQYAKVWPELLIQWLTKNNILSN